MNERKVDSAMVSATSTNTLTSKSNSVSLDTSTASKDIQMQATVAIASPEILAAKDVRVLNIIENRLMDCQFNPTMTDDLVLTIQEFMINDSKINQKALALLADNAKLRGVFKLIQQIKNSPEFLALVTENTPDESIPLESAESFVNPPQVIAVATTAADVVSSKPENPSAKTKTPKSKQLLPMPTIASIAELEALDRRGLMDSVKALNDHVVTGIRANAASDALKITLAKHVLKIADYKPSAKVKPGKAPKTSKGNTTPIIRKEDIDLSTLTWEDCRDNMSYRQLQQVCGALKAQKLFAGNCGGKGATKENFMKGIADYFRSKGVSVVEVTVSPSKTPKSDLNLPNWKKIKEDARLEKATTQALKLSNEDAKVALELAVAA